MTPLAGLALAVIAGWITRDARRAAAIIIVPFLAMTALQTYGIADGRGVSPPTTVWPLNGTSIPYYVVQLLIGSGVFGVGMLLATVRAQRATPGTAGQDLGRRTIIAAATAAILTAGYMTVAWLDSKPVAHHSSHGSPPAQGLIGIGGLIIGVLVLAAMVITGRRRAAAVASLAGPAAGNGSGHSGATSASRVGALAAGAALMLGGAGVTAAHAAHQAAAATGLVHVYETGTGGPVDADVLTGVIGDHGHDHEGVAANVNKMVLTKGTFELNTSKIGARLRVIAADRSACTLVVRGTAPVRVSHGTGRYAGIHGTLSVTLQNVLVFPRKKSGACNEQLSAAKVELTWATGSGHLSF